MNEMGKNVNLLSDSFSGLQFKLFTQMKRQQQQSQTKKFALGINFQAAPLCHPLASTPLAKTKRRFDFILLARHTIGATTWQSYNFVLRQGFSFPLSLTLLSASLSFLPLPLLATCSWPANWAFFLVALLFSNCWLTNLMWNSIWARIAMRLGRGSTNLGCAGVAGHLKSFPWHFFGFFVALFVPAQKFEHKAKMHTDSLTDIEKSQK